MSRRTREKIQGTNVIISTGTNDIRNQTPTDQVIDNTQEATDLLEKENIPYKVTQLPPNNLPTDIKHETIYFNRQILKNYGQRTIKTNNLYEKENMVDADKFHLTNQGQQEMARLIAAEIKKGITTKTEREKEKQQKTNDRETKQHEENTTKQQDNEIASFTIRLESSIVGRVIGKDGTNVKKVRDNHQVGLCTKRDDNGGAKLTITGPRQNVTKAREEMDRIIEKSWKNAERDHSREDRRRTQVCWNYKNGTCPYGNRCWYSHTDNPLDVSARSSPERLPKRPRIETPQYRDDKENVRQHREYKGEHRHRSRDRHHRN